MNGPAEQPSARASAVPELPSAPLRVAAVQIEATPGAVADNARRAADLAAGAAARGARVVVLPELHLCAYDLPTVAAAPAECEIAADESGVITDGRLEPLAEAASRTGALILAGAAIRRPDGRLANSVVAARPSGAVAAVYDKQHLWHADEARLFTAGRAGAALEADGWRLGLAVCYDMSFPEHARAAALSGAHAYLCLGAFASGNEHRAAVYLAARALENTVYSVFANPVGGPAARPARGGSVVYAPDGTLVAGAGTDKEGTILADLDPARMAEVRSFLRMLDEQRARLDLAGM
ncbi:MULTISPECIES: carbon-nitrogen hydrolase family protein [Streptomyces]|uniref:Carbon-nitrogen hydrolase family protein n=1 Tax=Streptomyces eurythermus TaxID=42237 RepID=A0ABW6ZAJ4_9ACTN|nr:MULTISPECIES: carbon-nitrogen hydrolase family protein [Streptomyces]